MPRPEFRLDVTPCSVKPLTFEDSKCVGCNRCAAVCQADVLVPSAEPGKPPIAAWPGECWFCGCCVMACAHAGAITLHHPLMNRTRFTDVVPEPENIK